MNGTFVQNLEIRFDDIKDQILQDHGDSHSHNSIRKQSKLWGEGHRYGAPSSSSLSNKHHLAKMIITQLSIQN